MSFRADVLADAGDLCEDSGRLGSVPPGCEETELCVRIRQRRPAARILLSADAIGDHRVPSDRVTWRYGRAVRSLVDVGVRS